MKTWKALFVLSLCLWMILSGCGAKPAEEKNVSIEDVVAKIQEVNPVKNPRALDAFALEYEMMLTPALISEYQGMITNAQDDCALIFVAKAAAGKSKELRDALRAYRDSLAANDLYVEYADKVRQAENAVVEIYGEYVVMVVAGVNAEYSAITPVIEGAFAG